MDQTESILRFFIRDLSVKVLSVRADLLSASDPIGVNLDPETIGALDHSACLEKLFKEL